MAVFGRRTTRSWLRMPSLVIVGVQVATLGSDQGQRVPMIEQVSERCGRAPDAWLVDGGFVGHEQIEPVSQTTTIYGPARVRRRGGTCVL